MKCGECYYFYLCSNILNSCEKLFEWSTFADLYTPTPVYVLEGVVVLLCIAMAVPYEQYINLVLIQ